MPKNKGERKLSCFRTGDSKYRGAELSYVVSFE